MAFERRSYAGAAAPTTLSSGINNSTLTINVVDGSGYPDGSGGPFVIVVGRATAGEEKILCTSRSTNTITATTRGYDGTSAASHSSGVPVEHCLTAVDLDEANRAVSETIGRITTQGDLIVGASANTFARLAKGTSGLPLVAGASTVSYAQVDTGGIADGAITTGKLDDEAVTTGKLDDGAVTTAKLAAQTSAPGWGSYTPSVDGLTIGNGQIDGEYMRFGPFVLAHVRIVGGSTTEWSGGTWAQTAFTLPTAFKVPPSAESGSPWVAIAGMTHLHYGPVSRTGGFIAYNDGKIYPLLSSPAAGDGNTLDVQFFYLADDS